jgi:hypothetical protein
MADPTFPSEWHARLADLANHIKETLADHPENGGPGHHVMPGSYTGRHAKAHQDYHASLAKPQAQPVSQQDNPLFAEPANEAEAVQAEAEKDASGHWAHQPRDGGKFCGPPGEQYYKGRLE